MLRVLIMHGSSCVRAGDAWQQMHAWAMVRRGELEKLVLVAERRRLLRDSACGWLSTGADYAETVCMPVCCSQ